ncbi:Pre-rRNA-processing protein esf1, partial [Diplodia seriata]
DPRFSNIHSDPRFRLPSKKNTHVTLDKRFAHMLDDDDFTRKASVDRYGRKITKDAGKKELERMYRVADEDEDEDEDEEKADVDDDDEVQKELARVDRKYDPAREGGFSSSEDESDEEDEDEVEVQEQDAFEFPTGGKEAEIEEMEDATPRLAVVNLDWDNIRAADLMAVANSFAPEGGRILNVTVYPSEFGRERMEREELEGPPREIFAKNKKDDFESSEESEEDSDDEEERIKKDLLQEDKGDEFDSKALRQYQLERLRYYYAVITADSAGTARHIYENMDGREYLSSANFFDLRFVPDEVSFDEDKPRDECKRIPDGYRPNDFVTDALTHSRVKLTWDADDNARKEIQKRAFSQKEIDDNDLQAYIGSDSSSDQDSGSEGDSEAEIAAATTTDKDAKKRAREEKAAKLRAALGLGSGSAPAPKKSRDAADKPVGDMQITFTSGLSSAKADKKAVFENQPEESTKDKYLRKEKERKQRRKERAKARRMGLDPDDPEALAKVREDEAASSSDEEAAVARGGEQAEDGDDADDADPFNDPFFENPEAERKRAFKEAKKADKQRKREAREAQAAKSAAERAQLELLMAEDEGKSHLRHFDINEIEKAEKKKGKKGKRGKKGKKEEDGEDAAAAKGEVEDQEGFQMDTRDPRFKALFESHEFAIDPTNPRFRGTKGMKALLEEGRKKRKMRRGGGELEEEEAEAGSRGKRARKTEDADDGRQQDDLKRLVERVKGKSKKAKA